MKYEQLEDGKWIEPVRKGYRAQCCGCGLVHRIDFRVIRKRSGAFIQVRFNRASRSTAAARAARTKKNPEWRSQI